MSLPFEVKQIEALKPNEREFCYYCKNKSEHYNDNFINELLRGKNYAKMLLLDILKKDNRVYNIICAYLDHPLIDNSCPVCYCGLKRG